MSGEGIKRHISKFSAGYTIPLEDGNQVHIGLNVAPGGGSVQRLIRVALPKLYPGSPFERRDITLRSSKLMKGPGFLEKRLAEETTYLYGRDIYSQIQEHISQISTDFYNLIEELAISEIFISEDTKQTKILEI